MSWAVAAALYFASAAAMIQVSALSAQMAAFWPPNGILLYALLVNTSARRWRFYAGACLASLSANLIAGDPAARSIIFTAANLLEVWLVVWLMRVCNLRRGRMLRPQGIARFPVIAAVGAATSASIAQLAQSDGFGRDWLSWFASDLLGLMIVVPALLVLFARRADRAIGARQAGLVRLAMVSAAVAAVAGFVFFFSVMPIVFCCILPMSYAVFHFGARGAVLAMLINAAIGITATVNGLGPFAAFTPDAALEIYLLQTFLAALLLAGLPLAALRTREERLSHRMLAAERLAGQLAHNRQRALEVAARQGALRTSRDDLTGLATRARALAKLKSRLAFQARSGTPLAIAVIDIDHFKQINDTHGHDHGDAVLRAFGQLANATFEAPHCVGRLGGEEFLVVLAGLDEAAAMRRLEAFRLRVEARPGSGLGRDFSISSGVAVAHPGMTASHLLKLADMALLLAKRHGRNRTMLAA